MDLEQFLAEGPLEALLGMAVIPVVAALALIGYLTFAFTRRSKKSRMKLGLQPGQKEGPVVEKTRKVGAEQVDAPAEAIASGRISELNMALLTPVDDAPPPDFEPERVDLSSRLSDTASRQSQPKPPPLAVSIPQPAADEPAELLRLLRQPESGQLVVEIAGQQFTKLAEIKDRKLGQFVLRLVAQLLAFTGGAILTESGVKSVGAPPAVPLPEPPFTPVRRATASPPAKGTADRLSVASPVEVEARLLSSLSAPPAPPVSKGGGMLGFGAKPKPASAPAASDLLQLDLAGEINNVVQKNLARSPLADSNRVEITGNLSGGLRILVNQQVYGSPEDIPDEAVKKLIKDSIKEWERL